MVISGMRTAMNNKNGVISIGSSSGPQISIPAQTNHLNQLRRNNVVRMRSGREIIREPGTAAEQARGEENGNPSRKRHRRQEPPPPPDDMQRNAVPRKVPYGRRRSVLFGEGEEGGSNEEPPRKRSILFWLIDSGTVPLNAPIFYVNKEFTTIINQGKITKDGLLCGCCNRVLTMSEFEVHAGSKLSDPYRNIFLQSGKNLLNCQTAGKEVCSYVAMAVHQPITRAVWVLRFFLLEIGSVPAVNANIVENINLHLLVRDLHVMICNSHLQHESLSRHFNKQARQHSCGEGGVLICCDDCPSTYHQSCMGIEVLPPGDWICPRCKCKYCKKHQSAPASPRLTCLDL